MQTTEYYRDDKGNDILPSARWWGDGVGEFDLNNPERDANKDFERLLLGLHPDTGKELSDNSGGNRKKRLMGIDLTFSAEKPFSIQFALEGSERQREIGKAHERATEQALRYISGELTARTGKAGMGRAGALKLIYRQVTHSDSREGDIQIHTHNVLIAMSKREDGKWRQADIGPLMAQGGPLMKSAGAVYRSSMAHGMRNLGYQVEQERALDADGRELGEVWHHLKEISKGEELLLSKRRVEIVQAVKNAEEDISQISIGFQEATQRTRQDKNKELTTGEICENAKSQILQSRSKGQTINEERKEFINKGEGEILEALHLHNSHFTRHDYIRAFSQEFDVENPAERANSLFQDAIRNGLIVEGIADHRGKKRFYSQEQFNTEKSIVDCANKRKDETRMRLTPELADESIARTEARQGFKFTEEQRNASKFVMCETGGVACVSGWAGTGKTATAGAYIDGFQSAGMTVYGTSTSAEAAKKLESEINRGKEKENKVECFSCAKLLSQIQKGKTKFGQNSVLIVDEAGMVEARTMRKLQIEIDKAGGKMVLVGDALQLQPIGAGCPFREMKLVIGEAEQTEIRRQKNANDLALANKFYNGMKGKDIIDELKKSKQLATSNNPITNLVNEYFSNPKSQNDKLILVQTNVDGDAISKELRNRMKANGQLNEQIHHQEVKKDNGTTRNMEIALGEKIRFKKNASWLGVDRNNKGEVIGFKETKNGLQIQVKLESDIPETNGKNIMVPMWKYDRIEHAYTNTVHSAQGQGKDDVYCLMRAGEFLDRSMAMVSFTRTKENFKAYATVKDESRLADHLDQWGKKETAQEIAKPLRDERLTPEVAQRAQERARRTGCLMEPNADNQQVQKNLEQERVRQGNNNSHNQSGLAVDKPTKEQEEIKELGIKGLALLRERESFGDYDIRRQMADSKYQKNLQAYADLLAPKIKDDRVDTERLEKEWIKERGQEEINAKARHEQQRWLVYGFTDTSNGANNKSGAKKELEKAQEEKKKIEMKREKLAETVKRYKINIQEMDKKNQDDKDKVEAWISYYKKSIFGTDLSKGLKDWIGEQFKQFHENFDEKAGKPFEYMESNTLPFPKELGNVPNAIKKSALNYVQSSVKIDITKEEIDKRYIVVAKIDKEELPAVKKVVDEKHRLHKVEREKLDKERRYMDDLTQMKHAKSHPLETAGDEVRKSLREKFNREILSENKKQEQEQQQQRQRQQQSHELKHTRKGPSLTI